MRYWVYGVDGSSKQPRDPLFIEADSEEAARARATEEGMQVEEIEAVQPRSPAPPHSEEASVFGRFFRVDHLLARCLIVVLRVLAVIAAIWGLWNTGVAIEAAGAVGARAKELERIAPGGASATSSAAVLAVFAAIVYGVALVTVLFALAEGLRLAIIIERHTRGEKVLLSREKRRHRSR